ncbi:MAG: hypothetical protein JWN18_526 [Parcubacteria group bacterium]|nr:hypothetical protein [Parcubacteria group bacterium]
MHLSASAWYATHMKVFPQNEQETEKEILWFFDLALLLKGVGGALEFLGAILVLFVPPSFILWMVELLTGGELAQDVDDPVATFLRTAADSFTVHPHYFLAAYLALRGVIKVVLVIGIFKGKRIAYPLFMLSLGLFGAYEAYRGFVRHEILLQALAVFDFAVILLTSHEYRRRYPTLASPIDTHIDSVAQ